ncbi:MAG: hypothetical protein QOF58_6000, partial [Pseudonocardiales bacterium]|nr:hypothetical protein [Pseudonocardiales bacterium]
MNGAFVYLRSTKAPFMELEADGLGDLGGLEDAE